MINTVQDGTKILSGGADNAGRMFDVTTGQSSQVAMHDAPIKCVRWIESPQGGVLVTGSWDKTVKVNDSSQCNTALVLTTTLVLGFTDADTRVDSAATRTMLHA